MQHSIPSELETNEVFEGVHLAELTMGDRTNVNYVQLDPGAEVPLHSHDNEQHGFVHEGTLTLTFEDRDDLSIAAGEGYFLESDLPHRAVNRADVPVVAIDIFTPPRRISPDA